MNNVSKALLSAAVVGLFAGAQAQADHHEGKKAGAKKESKKAGANKCGGANGCGGKKEGADSCKGKTDGGEKHE